jgi:GR25 family glycosyltransferase involved in LPS biosynthesis
MVVALEKADKTGISEMVVVVQGSDTEVLSIIKNIDWISCKILFTEYPERVTAKEAINRNLHLGLKHSFSIDANEYVVVLEDDICISKDFFLFVKACYEQNSKDRYFRAINGFSGLSRDNTAMSNYGKYRFGVGWGWVLPKRTWDELMGFWHGDENQHWDGLIESFMKTGFTVAPGMSRIRNIGFGEGATHTNAAGDPAVLLTQKKLGESFVGSLAESGTSPQFTFVADDLNWREDCRIFDYPSTPRRRVINFLYLSMHQLFLFQIRFPTTRLIIQKLTYLLRKVAFSL